MGTARIPAKRADYNSVVQLLTTAGIIEINGRSMSFSQDSAGIFKAAGFTVAASGRRLLGFQDLIGFFNSIPSDMWQNLGANDLPPRFPEKFHAKMKNLQVCSTTEGGNRCNGFKPDYVQEVRASAGGSYILPFDCMNHSTGGDTG